MSDSMSSCSGHLVHFAKFTMLRFSKESMVTRGNRDYYFFW